MIAGTAGAGCIEGKSAYKSALTPFFLIDFAVEPNGVLTFSCRTINNSYSCGKFTKPIFGNKVALAWHVAVLVESAKFDKR